MWKLFKRETLIINQIVVIITVCHHQWSDKAMERSLTIFFFFHQPKLMLDKCNTAST